MAAAKKDTQDKPEKPKKSAPKKSAKERAKAKRLLAQKKILKLRPGARKKADLPAEVLDARNVLMRAKRYQALLRKKGMKPGDLKTLADQIDLAEATGAGGRFSLAEARRKVRESLGAYRGAARLACRSMTGTDHEMEKTLRVDLSFPDTDPLLDAYVNGIGEIVKANSAALVERDFKKAEQETFIKAATEFHAAYTAKPGEQKKLGEQTRERDVICTDLRTMTSYIREMGVSALKNDSLRSQFDRVASKPKVKRKVPPTEKGAKGEASAKSDELSAGEGK